MVKFSFQVCSGENDKCAYRRLKLSMYHCIACWIFFSFFPLFMLECWESSCDHSEELHCMKRLMLYDEPFWMHASELFFNGVTEASLLENAYEICSQLTVCFLWTMVSHYDSVGGCICVGWDLGTHGPLYGFHVDWIYQLLTALLLLQYLSQYFTAF